MPYKRTYKKKTYARKRPARKSTLAREVRLIKRTITPELKLHEPVFTPTFLTTTDYTLLNDVGLGTGAYQRVGNNLLLKSIHFRGTIEIDPALAITDVVMCRVMLVWCKQPQEYVLDDDWLFGTSLFTAGNTDQFTSYSDRKTFSVLYDKTFMMAPGIKLASKVRIAKSINKQVEFGTSGNINTGSLYMVTYSNAGGATAPVMTNPTTRVFYTDC